MTNTKENGRYKKRNDFSELEVNPYVVKWLANVKNKRDRLSILDRYCKFLDKDVDTIILEHAKDIRQENPLDIKNTAKNQLNHFFGYLTGTEDEGWKNTLNDKVLAEDERVSWNSARQYVYSKLASIFKRNNVAIVWQKNETPGVKKGTTDKIWRNGRERISIDNRKECLKQIRDSFESIRDRAILLCKISSGMDDVDLFKLTIKDYKLGIYPVDNVCYEEGVRQKISRKGIRFQTFFNSEACAMVNLYIKERESKEGELDENGILFVTKNKSNGKYIPIKRHFADNLKKVCNKLNIKNITPKSLRRWFKTELSKQGIRIEFIKRMMGQAISIDGTSYEGVFDDPDEFKKEYVENIEQFTLLGNGGQKLNKVDKKVEKLEQQNNDLIEQLADTNKRLDKLEKYLTFEGFDKSELNEIKMGIFMKRFKDMIPTDEEEKELKEKVSQEKPNK